MEIILVGDEKEKAGEGFLAEKNGFSLTLTGNDEGVVEASKRNDEVNERKRGGER